MSRTTRAVDDPEAREAGPEATLLLNDFNVSPAFEAQIDSLLAGDRRPDVVQTFRDGALAYQDEDTDHDGVIDQRFEGSRAVAVPAGTRVQGARFGKLGCGSFHRFWWRR